MKRPSKKALLVGVAIASVASAAVIPMRFDNANNKVVDPPSTLDLSSLSVILGPIAGEMIVPTEVYDAAGWNGDFSVPTKDAVRDKIETLSAGGASPTTTRGDLIRRGASADEALPIGPFGDVLISDGTDPQWLGMRKWVTIFENEFASGINTLFSVFANTYFDVATPSSDAPGVFVMNSTGTMGIVTTSLAQLTFGSGAVRFQTRIRMVRLSVAGDNVYRIGFGDTSDGSTFTDGVWFEYTDNVNSGNWVGKCKAGATTGSANLAVGPTIDTWYWLTIDINAGATAATFSINGANSQTVSTANSIPNSLGELLGVVISGISTTGNLNQLYVDALGVHQLMTTPR